MTLPDDVALFEARTPLDFRVRLTRARWELIAAVKHPVMRGRELSVRMTLEGPDEVRQSRSDPTVLLFYRMDGTRRWVCAVAKWGDPGFLITAYLTDAIKEGEKVWPR